MCDVPWFEPSQTLQAVTVAAMAYGRGSEEQRARWAPQLRRWLDVNTGWPIMRQLKPLVESELDPSVDGWQSAITEMEAQHCPPHLIAYAWLEQARLQLRKGHRTKARASAAEAAKMAGRHDLPHHGSTNRRPWRPAPVPTVSEMGRYSCTEAAGRFILDRHSPHGVIPGGRGGFGFLGRTGP